jgi:hypothetical protein
MLLSASASEIDVDISIDIDIDEATTPRLHISLHLHNLFSFSGCEPDLPGALTPPQALDIPFSLLAARAGRLQGLPLAQAAFTTAPAWKSKSHASARALMSELGGG